MTIDLKAHTVYTVHAAHAAPTAPAVLVVLVALLGIAILAAGCANDEAEETPATCDLATCGDAPPPTCVADVLRTYDAACADDTCVYPGTDVVCAAGCCDDHCCLIDVSNANEVGDLEETGRDVTANGVFDTSSQCDANAMVGACSVVVRPELGELCVCRADRMTIGNLRVTGQRALALLAFREIAVTGMLDVGGHGDQGGPGARTFAVGARLNVGGIGGGHATPGATTEYNTTLPSVFGFETLIPLTAGMSGQATELAAGGGGGGAVQLSAGEAIHISGSVRASGGGGRSNRRGGSGGGAGGAILVEAPSVTILGSLVANGGGGGGAGNEHGNNGLGGNGEAGADGSVDLAPARGGMGVRVVCSDGVISGGNGGAGATGSVAATPALIATSTCWAWSGNGGGGGGGVGRIRINTNDCACSAPISPAATFGTLRAR